MRRQLAGTVLLFALIASSGCAAAGDADEPGRAAPPAPGDTPRLDELSASSIEDVSTLADAIRDQQNSHVRDCMANEGFPQLVRAKEMEIEVETPGQSQPTRIDPLEMGPYTKRQAREFGMIGTTGAFEKSRPGSVRSADAAFDEAHRRCQRSFDEEVDTDVASLLRRIEELGNTIRQRLTAATEGEISDLVADRLACVRDNGYPALDPSAALGQEDLGKILRMVGITPGDRSERPPRQKLEQGEVVVASPVRATYDPSDQEVDFALVYVECGKKQNFVEHLNEIQSRALEDILNNYEAETIALGKEVKRAVQNVADGQ